MIPIVENGIPCATIVLGSSLESSATEAVTDMRRVVEKMSGAVLMAATDGEQDSAGCQIHIGSTQFVTHRGLQPEHLPVNGYRIVTTDEGGEPRLVIAAATSLGVSHGVYDLLANELGVVWGMANPLFEDIPIQPDISVQEQDCVERPAFGFRVFSGVDPIWLRRNRVDDGSRQLPFYGHGHNLFNVFPPSQYADHPEYYAMLEGERQIPEQDGHTRVQPCLSNPEVIRITIETVRRFFDENPGVSTYSLCPNDSPDFCECQSCLALDDGVPEYRGRRMNSDSYFHYINAVATELLKTHPDRYVSAYAYWTTELVPRAIPLLPPNVVIYLTQDSSQYYDNAYEQRDHDILEQWSKVAHHLAVYDYYGLGWFAPRYFPGVVARTLPYLPTVNVKGFYCESYPYWSHMAPQLYLATRLLWDTSVDAESVLDEWYNRMFREVGSDMRRYYESLERGWMDRSREGQWFLGLDRLHVQLAEWPAASRDEAWGHLNRAYDRAADDLTRQRVEYVRWGNQFAFQLSIVLERVHSLEENQSNRYAELTDLLGQVAQTMALFQAHIESDLTYGSAYYQGERATSQLSWWLGYMGVIIEEKLADEEELHRRLLDEQPIYSKMIEARDHPGVERRIQQAREARKAQ